ncbi:MAG: type 4a pilus biogenesis protein PilO [Candidatus Omnitrophica bacterium]|nr:type 4a pilus biogenesis protein PilO [Candidatus Omnitrophota bacterium]
MNLGIDLKNTRQVILIAVAAGAAVLFIYVKFLLIPQIQNGAGQFEKARRLRAEVAATERDVASIEGLKKQMMQYHTKIESYERMLPVEQEIPKLLEDLSNMAKRSGVKIVGITPLQSDEEAREGIYQEIPILINAKSGYHELGKFLSELENASRFMKVVDIAIKENRAAPKRHEIEVLVATYKLIGTR